MKRIHDTSSHPQTGTVVADRETQPKWHYLYFMLAVFNVVTVLATLYIDHYVSGIFVVSMTAVQQWEKQLNNYVRLQQLPDAINA